MDDPKERSEPIDRTPETPDSDKNLIEIRIAYPFPTTRNVIAPPPPCIVAFLDAHPKHLKHIPMSDTGR